MEKRIEFDYLSAMMQGVVLPQGPKLDQLIISSPAAEISLKPFELKLEQAAEVEARVSEASLAEFLDDMAPAGLYGFEAKCADGQIKIRAKAKFIVEIPVEAVCTLRIEGGRNLHVDLVSVNVLGGGATSLVEEQIKKVNPILKGEDIPFDFEMDTVEITDGMVVIKGRAAM
jgi:hypothetical protein